MKKFLVSSLLFLVGCNNHTLLTPTEQGVPFCYTTETIVSNGEIIDSKTVIECSDKPRLEHFVKDTGMAKDCTPYAYNYTNRGTTRYVQAFLCKFPDGSWQAVDGRYAY